MAIATIWLLAGAALIILEVITAPGLGIFLAGLGAMSTALVINAGIVAEESVVAQFAWAFAFTVIWIAILWKPLKNFRAAGRNKLSPDDSKEHSDMVGTTAIVSKNGLARGMQGQVVWSGTLMSAVLAEQSGVDSVPEGAQVKIVSVSGTTLTVQPIHRS